MTTEAVAVVLACAAGLLFLARVLSVVIGEPAFVGRAGLSHPTARIFESVGGLCGILSIDGLVTGVSMIEGARLLMCERG